MHLFDLDLLDPRLYNKTYSPDYISFFALDQHHLSRASPIRRSVSTLIWPQPLGTYITTTTQHTKTHLSFIPFDHFGSLSNTHTKMKGNSPRKWSCHQGFLLILYFTQSFSTSLLKEPYCAVFLFFSCFITRGWRHQGLNSGSPQLPDRSSTHLTTAAQQTLNVSNALHQ